MIRPAILLTLAALIHACSPAGGSVAADAAATPAAADASVNTAPVQPRSTTSPAKNDQAPAATSAWTDVYTCQFADYGEVVIMFNKDDASIVVDGERHPATGGSYFYQTSDGSEIALMFGPGSSMETWTFQGPDGEPEEATRCVHSTGGSPGT